MATLPSGRVRVTTMEYGVRLLFERGLAQFLDSYPKIEIEHSVDMALVDLVESNFDVGIRYRGDVPGDMVAIPIGSPVAFVAVASPAYLAKSSQPQRPADLLKHQCIRQRMASGAKHRWSFQDGGRNVTIDPPGRLTVESIKSTVTAAVRGAGIGYLPRHHAADLITSGTLIVLLDRFSSTFDGHCLYYKATKQPTQAFAAFIDYMRGRHNERAIGSCRNVR